MKLFNTCVGWNNCYNKHFRISDPEVIIEKGPIGGNAQSMVAGNNDNKMTRVEDALQNKIFGEWN
jgi:hypothetical protein